MVGAWWGGIGGDRKMSTYFEMTLRTIGVFLNVFFTVRWGSKSKGGYENVFIVLICVLLAIIVAIMF
jgi:hypothetical protein